MIAAFGSRYVVRERKRHTVVVWHIVIAHLIKGFFSDIQCLGHSLVPSAWHALIRFQARYMGSCARDIGGLIRCLRPF